MKCDIPKWQNLIKSTKSEGVLFKFYFLCTDLHRPERSQAQTIPAAGVGQRGGERKGPGQGVAGRPGEGDHAQGAHLLPDVIKLELLDMIRDFVANQQNRDGRGGAL